MTELVILAVAIVVVVVALVPISRYHADRTVARMHAHRKSTPESTYIPSDLWDDMQY